MSNEKKLSKVDLILDITKSDMLYKTSDNRAFVKFKLNKNLSSDYVEMHRYRNSIIQRSKKLLGFVPTKHQVNQVLDIKTAEAFAKESISEVFIRCCQRNDGIWLDTGRDDGKLTHLSKKGIDLIDSSEKTPLFYRPSTFLPLPDIGEYGDVDLLFKHINIKGRREQKLLLVAMANAFFTNAAQTILVLVGPQGSAKSTTSKCIKGILDPSKGLVQTLPSSDKDLLLTALNNFVIAFDNISGIRNSMSDSLCRLSTGGGISSRALYTNSDIIVLDVKRFVILNGIDDLTKQYDFIDRAIIIEAPKIKATERKTDLEISNGFQKDMPYILRGLFEMVVVALNNLPNTKIDKLPRMASYGLLGTATEEFLGLESGEFMKLYNENIESSRIQAISNDIVAKRLLNFMDGDIYNEARMSWEGTASELFDEIKPYSTEDKYLFPKGPEGLGKDLRRLQSGLNSMGFQIDFTKRSDRSRTRMISIKKLDEEMSEPSNCTKTENSSDSLDSAFEEFNNTVF